MMYKFSSSLILVTFILSCNSVNKKENIVLNSTYINTTKLLKNIQCNQKIKSFGLTEETPREFLGEITDNEDSIENLTLIFYKEEGEVINLYKAGIVKYKDETKVFYSLNSNEIEVNRIKSNDILHSLMEKVEELEIPTNRQILIIKINSDKSTCTLYKNIKAIETLENKILF